MNHVKLQCDIVKWAAKGKNDRHYMYGITDDDVAVVIDGHVIYFVSKVHWMLNTEMCFLGTTPFNVRNIMQKQEDLYAAEPTGNLKTATNGRVLWEFGVEKTGELVYVAEEYIKPLDLKYGDMSYAGTNHKSPIYCYEGEELRAIILPVNFEEGKK